MFCNYVWCVACCVIAWQDTGLEAERLCLTKGIDAAAARKDYVEAQRLQTILESSLCASARKDCFFLWPAHSLMLLRFRFVF